MLEMCENHSNVSAIAKCVVCGKPVCKDCSTIFEEKYFCDDERHLNVNKDFTKLLTTTNVFEMELVANNLRANGIDVQWFNPKYFGVQEHPRLFVNASQISHALGIIKELDIADFTSLENYD